MKKIVSTAILSLLLFSLVAGTAWADGPFYSYFQVANLDDTETANVVVEYYDTSGTKVSTATETANILPGESATFYQSLNAGLPAGFRGSAVVSSNVEIGAIASDNDTGGLSSAASSEALSSGSQTVYLPLMMHDYSSGWNTRFAVQNIGDTATNVTVNYSSGLTRNYTVQPYASAYVDQSQETGFAGKWKGSATLTSDTTDIIASVEVWQAGYPKLQSYNGFGSGASTVYVPLAMKNYSAGWNTYIQVQNVTGGGTSTDVTVEYSDGTTTTPQTIADGGSYTYYQSLEGGLPAKWKGSAKITASGGGKIVAIVTQAGPSGDYSIASYNGFADTAGSTSWSTPLVMKKYSAGWYTYSQVQNISGSSVNVTVNYSDGTTHMESIAAGDSYTFYTSLESGLADGFKGAATISATGNVVVLSATAMPGGSGDRLGNYWGIATQ